MILYVGFLLLVFPVSVRCTKRIWGNLNVGEKFKYGGQACTEEIRSKVEPVYYNNHMPPFPADGSPLGMYAAMYIEGISSVATVTMDFSIDIYFTLRWVDERVSYTCNISDNVFTIFPNQHIDMFWLPGIYFANSRQADFHHVMQMNSMFWIWPDGNVRYNSRITLKVICNMQLEVYPFDTQHCELMFLDYSFPNTLLNVSWMPKDIEQSIAISRNIEIPEMIVSSVNTEYCDGAYPAGVWSCLILKIVLVRITSYHMYQTYLPSALIVLISSTNFWLDVDAMPGRISLSITTLLTLTTQASSLRLALPPVSYMKAIDVWMMTCQFFVLGALLEFTLVNYISRKYKSIERKQMKAKMKSTAERQSPEKNKVGTVGQSQVECSENKPIDVRALAMECRQQAQSIDYLARVIYPLLFLVFNIVYWIYYMIQANKF